MLNLSYNEVACYLAGFFDGEGCFRIAVSEQNSRGQPRVQVGNTHYEVLYLIQCVLDGWGIHASMSRKTTTGNRKMCYEINVVSSKNVYTLCDILKPYLVVKQEHAALIMQFIDLRFDDGYHGKTNEDEERMIIERIKELNHRGL